MKTKKARTNGRKIVEGASLSIMWLSLKISFLPTLKQSLVLVFNNVLLFVLLVPHCICASFWQRVSSLLFRPFLILFWLYVKEDKGEERRRGKSEYTIEIKKHWIRRIRELLIGGTFYSIRQGNKQKKWRDQERGRGTLLFRRRTMEEKPTDQNSTIRRPRPISSCVSLRGPVSPWFPSTSAALRSH